MQYLQCDWLAALVQQDVLKCFITESGEQCAVITSLTQQHVSSARCSQLGTVRR